MKNIHQLVRENLNCSRKVQTFNNDKRVNPHSNTEIGSLVLLSNSASRVDAVRKFEEKYNGPFEIIKNINNLNFVLKEIAIGKIQRVHFNRLKTFNVTAVTLSTEPAAPIETEIKRKRGRPPKTAPLAPNIELVESDSDTSVEPPPQEQAQVVRTRYGRTVNAPQRLNCAQTK